MSHQNDNGINREIKEVQAIMHNNIKKVLERDQNIHDLEDQSIILEHNAGKFKYKAKALKRKLWCEDKKKLCILLIAIMAILIVIILIIVYAPKP